MGSEICNDHRHLGGYASPAERVEAALRIQTSIIQTTTKVDGQEDAYANRTSAPVLLISSSLPISLSISHSTFLQLPFSGKNSLVWSRLLPILFVYFFSLFLLSFPFVSDSISFFPLFLFAFYPYFLLLLSQKHAAVHVCLSLA